MTNNDKFHTVSIEGVYNFADDYLTTIFCLLKSAEKNKNSYTVFTYTLPIIILSVCFLESNINNIVYLFSHPNNIINDYQKALIVNDLITDFKIMDKSILDKHELILKYYKNKSIKSDIKYERVGRIIEVRNALVHDKQKKNEQHKTTQEIMCILKKIKKLYPDFIVDNDIKGAIQPWLPFLGYNPTCWMLKCVFEFYLYYAELLFGKVSNTNESKIKNILKYIAE